jgi:hypothetical protein
VQAEPVGRFDPYPPADADLHAGRHLRPRPPRATPAPPAAAARPRRSASSG